MVEPVRLQQGAIGQARTNVVGIHLRIVKAVRIEPIIIGGGLRIRPRELFLGEACIHHLRPFDLRTVTVPVETMREAPQVRETMALAAGYARAGFAPAPFFALMAELVSRDEASEMHAYKMQQAAYEEFHATRAPYRWVHLVAAARHLATVYPMQPQAVYGRAARLLDL